LGNSTNGGLGVIKRYVLPAAALVALLAVAEILPALLGEPATVDLEHGSHRIGWSPASESSDLAYDIYLRVNDERLAGGLPPLTWHEGLASIAARWSEEMIATGYRHSTPEFRAHPDFAGTGENIFMGPTDAMEAHVGWMRSDGHRDNLLSPGYTAVGIGVVCRNDGHMWATQIFGLPHGSSGGPSAATPREPIVRVDEGPACPSSTGWPFSAPVP
jgi:uncharacterized protein YkwD